MLTPQDATLDDDTTLAEVCEEAQGVVAIAAKAAISSASLQVANPLRKFPVQNFPVQGPLVEMRCGGNLHRPIGEM